MGDIGGASSGELPQTVVMARFGKWAAITGVVAGLLFLLLPHIDLALTQLFYIGAGRFFGQGNDVVGSVRNVFLAAYVSSCALALAGIGLTLLRGRRWCGLGVTQWVFAALCLSVGPGLVANEIFKDNWGRARPRQVTEFSGDKPFTPPLVLARNCDDNCSFVSGEASSIFALFFAAGALYRRRPRVMIGAGIVLGMGAGAIRIMQGAHFLSDVVFAGVFMALTVVALFLAFDARTADGYRRVRFAVLGGAPAA